jgi:hypothetical protein
MTTFSETYFCLDEFKIVSAPNTDGMGNCLQQPGQLGNQLKMSMRVTSIHLLNFVYRDNSCCRDKVNRAAGRRAVVMVFAEPPRQFYRDERAPVLLPGLSHLDNFAWTRKLSSVYRDCAKTHANPDTDGNSPYHRAVKSNAGCSESRKPGGNFSGLSL